MHKVGWALFGAGIATLGACFFPAYSTGDLGDGGGGGGEGPASSSSRTLSTSTTSSVASSSAGAGGDGGSGGSGRGGAPTTSSSTGAGGAGGAPECPPAPDATSRRLFCGRSDAMSLVSSAAAKVGATVYWFERDSGQVWRSAPPPGEAPAMVAAPDPATCALAVLQTAVYARTLESFRAVEGGSSVAQHGTTCGFAAGPGALYFVGDDDAVHANPPPVGPFPAGVIEAQLAATATNWVYWPATDGLHYALSTGAAPGFIQGLTHRFATNSSFVFRVTDAAPSTIDAANVGTNAIHPSEPNAGGEITAIAASDTYLAWVQDGVLYHVMSPAAGALTPAATTTTVGAVTSLLVVEDQVFWAANRAVYTETFTDQ